MPAELRNNIYRFTLCEHTTQITQTTFQQPALLATCRQTRKEASIIYYYENDFDIHVHNFDPAVARSWHQHARPFFRKQTPKSSIIFGTVDPRSWTNLMRWIKLHVSREAVGIAQCERNDPDSNVAGGAMKIARELYAVETDWEMIEKVLEIYKVSTKYTIDWED